MSGVSIQWEFDHEPLLARLEALTQIDLDSIAAGIGAYMIGEIQDRFDSQRLWDGSAMPQSAAAQARGGQTLIQDHHLYDSYVWQPAGAGGVAFGSDSPYAAIHHWGGDAGRNHASHIDARPVMGINPDDEQAIGQLVFKAIQGV